MNKMESKKERFNRIASKRTNKVLENLRLLGNCSNRSVYEYSKEDIHKIFSAIKEKLAETKAKFHLPKDKEFKL